MKIFFTGANRYICKRLLPQLIELDHQVVCCVRDKNRIDIDATFVEMKLLGEAWLLFKIIKYQMIQQAETFRHKGIWGQLYWFSVLPFHYFIFDGMIHNIVNHKPD